MHHERNSRRAKTVIFFGPPGSGKGTQSTRLSTALGIPTISTGEILRREADSGSPIGKYVRAILASGRLVGDDLMNEVVARRLSEPDCEAGFILDGYPRTVKQAMFLQSLFYQLGLPAPVVLHL